MQDPDECSVAGPDIKDAVGGCGKFFEIGGRREHFAAVLIDDARKEELGLALELCSLDVSHKKSTDPLAQTRQVTSSVFTTADSATAVFI